MMPTGSADVRASATATLAVHIHAMSTARAIPDWIAEAKNEPLDEWQQANVREIERGFTLDAAIPTDLVEALSNATSKGEQAWRTLRAANNWQDFKPHLEEIFQLSREQGAALGEALGTTPYNALISIYQPGIACEDIDPIFSELREFLPGLIQTVLEKQQTEGKPAVTPSGIDINRQRELGLATMETLGFNFNRGRLDISHHPFCGGAAGDVRITTRYDEDNFLSSLQGVIHETGHALYEQHRPPAYLNQPVSEAMGMAIHESQSLFMEMQLGRSAPFIEHLAPIIRSHLAPQANAHDPQWSSDALYRLATQVKPGLIRVDADECTYPAHVILRYEMEQQLIAGSMTVADIPDAWNEAMTEMLGLSTEGNFKDGCMQDVHWPSGGVGYFPTYTLGAIAAAQFKAALRRDIPTVESQIGKGDLSATKTWLQENIWSQGSLHPMQDLMSRATGSKLNVADFKAHLKQRYLA
ncbi:UNVERIFIED_CONTAM: hypothetical protein GTU68_008095 [Idotea baltica]|nr:hypothetical protein [Idotea baltica]